MLRQQGRVTGIVDPARRIEAIAKGYVARPENAIIVSPDNASRQQINQAVRRQLQVAGLLDTTDHSMHVLTPRSGHDRGGSRLGCVMEPGDVLHYSRGSKEVGIESRSYARVVVADPQANLLTVEKQNGEQVTYDPSRLRGITAYRGIDREFAVRDRLMFTSPNRELKVANRDLGTVERIDERMMTVRMDDGKGTTVRFDPKEMRHFDHGYAVTSHTVHRESRPHSVLVNIGYRSPSRTD